MSHALIVVEALGDLAVGVVGGDLVRDEVVEANPLSVFLRRQRLGRRSPTSGQ